MQKIEYGASASDCVHAQKENEAMKGSTKINSAGLGGFLMAAMVVQVAAQQCKPLAGSFEAEVQPANTCPGVLCTAGHVWDHHARVRWLGRFCEQAQLTIKVTRLPGTGTQIQETLAENSAGDCRQHSSGKVNSGCHSKVK
jgi:hypothetical protein